jgi:NADH-quinone oxidoreductase subunit J
MILFASLSLISAFFVIQTNNPVHAVLFLIFSFCNVSALLICHALDFFALIFLIVYVGAIAVLFLFVIMMLNVSIVQKNYVQYLPIGGLIGFLFLLQIVTLFEAAAITEIYLDWSHFLQAATIIETIGQVFYTHFALFFILASLILLVSMIGAIVLTIIQSKTLRRQDIFEQNNRLFNNTVQKITFRSSII